MPRKRGVLGASSSLQHRQSKGRGRREGKQAKDKHDGQAGQQPPSAAFYFNQTFYFEIIDSRVVVRGGTERFQVPFTSFPSRTIVQYQLWY